MNAGSGHVAASSIHLPIRIDWLARHVEPILEPELTVIDPHHHLWDPPGRRYLLDDFVADVCTGHNIAATVFVQCRAMYRETGPDALKPVGETEFAAGVAAQSEGGAYGSARICAGIVGSLDFSLGERVEPVLEAHVRAGGGRFRGIRGLTVWDADPEVHKLPTSADVLMEQQTKEAIRRIERFGLMLDIWAFHTQMDQVIHVCQAFPELTIVIDHVAGPLGIGRYRNERDEVFAAWRGHINKLARLPNTLMKIGGLAMRYAGFDFHLRSTPPSSDELVDAWRPYVETCIQAFGPSRCMFESNFPVDKAMCSYPVLWNAFKKLCLGYNAQERRDLLCDTAARAYRINPSFLERNGF